MKKIKIGVIGAGAISDYHIKAYKKTDVELYAICDINETRAQQKAVEYGFAHYFADYRELLAIPEIDAVSVCVVNALHAEVSIAAIEAGKHVLCEKPMSRIAEKACEMANVAEKSGKLLMPALVRRFGADTNTVDAFISEDTFGDIYHSKCTYIRRNGSPGGWFVNKTLSGGGPVLDIGIHVLDLAFYFMGMPRAVEVSAVTHSHLKGRNHLSSIAGHVSADAKNTQVFDVEDFSAALIRFENGATLQLETSYSLNIKEDCTSVELYGTKGGAKIDACGVEIYSEKAGFLVDIKPIGDTIFNLDDSFNAEIEHFVNCVDSNTRCKSSAYDGAELMRIIDAIYRSADENKSIRLD